jgi:hypothetical protein
LPQRDKDNDVSQLLTNIILRLLVLCLLVSTVTATACAQRVANPQVENKATPAPSNVQGVLWQDVPQKVDAKAKYLFYLHGAIIENEGVHAVSPRFGAYEYEQILNAFIDKGFIVISEPRPRGTDVEKYAVKVVGQVTALLKAGVPPQRITVVGGSRGGQIAIATSTLLKNKDVNFVVVAGCGNGYFYSHFPINLYGNVLSIYDYKDDTGAGSCRRFLDKATGLNRHKEVELRVGLGHGIVFHPLKEWIDLVVEWANQS